MPFLTPGERLVSISRLFDKDVSLLGLFLQVGFAVSGLITAPTPSHLLCCHHSALFNSVSLYPSVHCSLRNNKASGRGKNHGVIFLENVDMKLIASFVKPCSS